MLPSYLSEAAGHAASLIQHRQHNGVLLWVIAKVLPL
jgi:hypothetical protein